MRRLFTKDQILTVPNLLSLVRLLLIPVIVWLFVGKKDYHGAAAIVILSGVTDIADGVIARRCNMVSDFGKLFDPVADKLTQAALLFCLIVRHPLMVMLLICFGIKEISTLLLGYRALKQNSVNCAQWYGKLNTVLLYAMAIILILFPGIPVAAANCMIVLCSGMSLVTAVLYARFYRHLLHTMTEEMMRPVEQ